MARSRTTDLLIACAVPVALLALVLLGVDSVVPRALLAGPVVLILPGYTLALALFPAWHMRRAELLALSLGLSLALAALGGLVLQVTPGGINANSWSILLCGFTLVSSVVALLRQRGVNSAVPSGADRIVVTRPHALMLGASVLVLGGAMWIARTPVPESPDQAYSVLWATPVNGQSNLIRLGVSSAELQTTNFTVRIVSAEQVLQEFPIQLTPEGAWQTDVALSGSTDQPIQVQLSRAETPDTIYRRVEVRPGG